MPWVAPFHQWLTSQGPNALTLILIAIGVITILIGLFGTTAMKILWGVYLLSP
jgi:hypothetical protein